ncbi:MAG: hypothetical protein KAU28_05650, partial [Phycisphaerae bacterium]|nr:hypothetical protein [Phycisphaerae bacterium]
MKLKTYQAQTMAEALTQVKRDMGREAVILHTRRFRKGALLGLLGGRRMWEVTASPNVNVPGRFTKGKYISDRPAETAEQAELPASAEQADQPAPETAEPAAGGGLGREIGQIRQMVEALLSMRSDAQSIDLPDELAELRGRLLRQDVEDQTVDELIDRLQLDLTGQQLCDKDLIAENLQWLIASRISTAVPVKPTEGGHARGVALIGPTGVGKT